MTYRTTQQADLDIANIFFWGVRQFGMEHAERYENGLFHAFRLLADNPLMARERPEVNRPVRFFPYKAHLIIYAIRDDGSDCPCPAWTAGLGTAPAMIR